MMKRLLVVLVLVACSSKRTEQPLSDSADAPAMDSAADHPTSPTGPSAPSDDANAPPAVPKSVSLDSPRALFLADSPSPAREGTAKKILMQLTNAGELKQASFKDDKGVSVEISVQSITKLNDEYVVVVFDGYPQRRAIVRLVDGVMFDVSQYPVETATLRGWIAYFAQDNTLFRLDLTLMTATPMNNPEFDPVSALGMGWFADPGDTTGSSFLVDNAGTALIGASSIPMKLLYANNRPPVSDNSGKLSPTVPGGARLATMYGQDGHYYSLLRLDGPSPAESLVRYTFTDAGVTEEQTPLGNHVQAEHSVPLYFRSNGDTPIEEQDRYVVFDNGFYHMTGAPTGPPSISFIDLALPASLTAQGLSYEKMAMSKGAVYWQHGDVLKRIRLEAGATEQTIATIANIISFRLLNGRIVYSKYLSATSIATFSLDPEGGEPVQVAQSDMKVTQIVELKL